MLLDYTYLVQRLSLNHVMHLNTGCALNCKFGAPSVDLEILQYTVIPSRVFIDRALWCSQLVYIYT